jgi:hypothetical protein
MFRSASRDNVHRSQFGAQIRPLVLWRISSSFVGGFRSAGFRQVDAAAAKWTWEPEPSASADVLLDTFCGEAL